MVDKARRSSTKAAFTMACVVFSLHRASQKDEDEDRLETGGTHGEQKSDSPNNPLLNSSLQCGLFWEPWLGKVNLPPWRTYPRWV